MSPPATLRRLPRISSLSPDDCRLLVESVRDYAIFMLDVRGHVATWNVGAERIKGYRADEIIGEHFSKFYPQEDIDSGKPERELATAIEQGRVEDEGWRLRKDGTRFWANVIITALRDETGRLRGFAKVTRDLTARKMAEEQLREAESRFHHLVDAVSDYAIYMLQPDGHVATWNAGAERIKGYRASEIIGKHFSLFYTPEDRHAGKPQRVLETVLREGRFEEEGWRIRKDGTRFWASVVITALRDERGGLRGFAKVTRDLTARREAEDTARKLLLERTAREAAEKSERQLRESEERFRALSRRLEIILEGMGDGVTVQDAEGRMTFANAAAKKAHLLDLDPRTGPREARFELLGAQGERLDADALPGSLALRGEGPEGVLVRIRERATGRERWSHVRTSPVLGEGGQAEMAISIWHDVTAERRHERHARLLADATAALAGSLDHEEMAAMLARSLVPELADWCSIYLLDGEELRSVATAHNDPARLDGARDYARKFPPPRTGEHGVWAVLSSGTPAVYNELSEGLLSGASRGTEHLEALRSAKMTAVMLVPIRVRDRVTGVFSLVSSESGRRFDDEDVSLVEELGRRVGAAIENARLYMAERRTRDHLTLLARAGEVFASGLDYGETLRNVVQLTLPTLADFAFVDVVEGGEIRRVIAAPDAPEVARLLREARWAPGAGRGDRVRPPPSPETRFCPEIDDRSMAALADGPEQIEMLRELGLRSLVSVPLRSRGDVLGTLTVCFSRSGRRHTPDDRKLTEELARRAAMALVQVRLYESAHQAARRAEEAARQAEAAMRVKDEFLATVSHELRTPLNAILGWSSLLRDRGADPQLAKPIDVIHRNAQAQARIVEDILDMSRIITGNLRLDVRTTDLVSIVHEAVEVVRPSAAAKRLSIELSPPAHPATLVADPERLKQVVWNLLSNAVKFTEPGGKIEVGVEQKGSKIVLSVLDSGRGIDPDFLPFVFDRFKQADGSTTRRFGGLGLGLAIVKNIVELHGGNVSAESSGKGQGALFRVTLPVRAVANPEPSAGVSSAPSDRSARRGAVKLDGVRVLVVDDDADARDLLHDVLASAGATVETSDSAAACIAAVRSFRPHVLVSDIGMPGQDGYGLIKQLRALAADEGGATPSIALTAYTRREDETKALSAGFTTHIGKPVDPADLLNAVAALAARE